MNNKYLYLIIVILLGCLLLQFGCSKEINEEKNDYSHLYKRIENDSMIIVSFIKGARQDSLYKIKSNQKIDSISNVSKKYIKLYTSASKIVHNQISEGICDTSSVKKLVIYCDSSIVSLKAESAQKDTTIKYQNKENEKLRGALKSSNDMNEAARQILKGQSDDNKALKDEIKLEKRKRKFERIGIVIIDILKDAAIIFTLKK